MIKVINGEIKQYSLPKTGILKNGVDKYGGSKINPYFYGEIKNLTKISLTPKENASQIIITLNSGAITQNHTGPYLAGQKYEFTF